MKSSAPPKGYCVAGGEQMLGRGGVRLARAPHLLRHREIDADHPVVGLRMAVAAALRGPVGGIKRLDRISHVVLLL